MAFGLRIVSWRARNLPYLADDEGDGLLPAAGAAPDSVEDGGGRCGRADRHQGAVKYVWVQEPFPS
jgi:hypothetical protein